MNNFEPKFSIITATWNCEATIADCLASVSGQTWPYRQHIVVDGASTDGTLAILNAHRELLAALLSQPDHGIYDALNKGLNLATGDVVGFLHADDLYTHSQVLQRVAEVFVDPSVCAVYGDLQYVQRNDITRVVRHWQSTPVTPARLSWGWMPPHPTLYVRRNWYQRIGGFNTQFRIAADYLSILQLFSTPKFKSVYLPEVLITMRLGGASNSSIRTILEKSMEDWRALRSCDFSVLGALRALAWKNLSKLSQFI